MKKNKITAIQIAPCRKPDPEKTLNKLKQNLSEWIVRTGDPGPETQEVYILETEDQMSSTGNKVSRENYRKNSEIYKNWFKNGK